MTDESVWTRRNVLRASGAVAGTAALAGCITGEGNGDGNGDGNGGDNDGPYTVSMPPVGEVEFESVPQTWAAGTGDWADMGIALGQEPPVGLYIAGRLHTGYYDDIPDVSVDLDEDDVTLWDDEFGPEKFLDLAENVDVLVMDPNFLTGRAEWSDDDIEQIETTGTPFFGNSIFSRDYPWHQDYEYLSMYEAFEKLAEVFQEQERFDEFDALHDDFQSELDTVVPTGDEPEAAVLYPQEGDSFLPYLIDDSTTFKHLRDLGVEDALANTDVEDFHSGRGSVDYETLLEIDPEYILVRTEQYRTEEEFQQNFVEPMRSHNVGQELTAVQNDNIYKTLPFYQGPIINLVATQRLAQQLYDVEDDLFDPQEVSDIVNGDF